MKQHLLIAVVSIRVTNRGVISVLFDELQIVVGELNILFRYVRVKLQQWHALRFWGLNN